MYLDFIVIIQLKEMTEKLPAEGEEREAFNSLQSQLESFLATARAPASSSSCIPINLQIDQHGSPQSSTSMEDPHTYSTGLNEASRITSQESNSVSSPNVQEGASQQQSGNRYKFVSSSSSNGVTQVIEQFEPGVYITLDPLPNGIKTFHRVKFRYGSFN